MQKNKKQYYAVANGKSPGMYKTWSGKDGAQDQVKGFPKAKFKGFYALEDAVEYLKENGADVSEYDVPVQRLEHDRVYMYTDGGALNNPGPGGYGVVLLYQGHRKELSGGYRLTTNNRMEMTACIYGLNSLTKSGPVTIYSDSKYIVDAVKKGWAEKWRVNRWLRDNKQPIENADLWQQLLDVINNHDIEFVWVKGHAGKKENERCDRLAGIAMRKNTLEKDVGYEETRELDFFE
jgi:ribonuclease HI